MKNKKVLSILVLLLLLVVLTGCKTSQEPIQNFKRVTDVLVWPMAGLMWIVGKSIAFKSYGLVIIITTILIRTLAWPIYARTNDMSLKMGIMGPELAKIEERYRDRQDQESQQRKQMETMQLYKKYGVGIGGCLMPLIQMPLFIAFYETLQRVPQTLTQKMNFDFLTRSFLGLNLFETAEGATGWQKYGIWVLAALVGITQIFSQLRMSQRQKKQKEAQQAGIPQYRRVAETDQQKQQTRVMQFMMYGMSIMMVVFVLRSTAALGLYWLVGNIYSTIQAEISQKTSKQRLEFLKSKI